MHLRRSQICLALPSPPNRTILRHALHSPHSAARHAAHSPHVRQFFGRTFERGRAGTEGPAKGAAFASASASFTPSPPPLQPLPPPPPLLRRRFTVGDVHGLGRGHKRGHEVWSVVGDVCPQPRGNAT